jgi:hypothetical protein
MRISRKERKKVKNKYYDFLCNMVTTKKEYEQKNYDALLSTLYKMDFYSLIPNDQNRCDDGLQLREKFIDEEGQHALSQSLFMANCTVFEMLIGLSYRLEFETEQSKWEKSPKEWFWILIDNLCLLDEDILDNPDEIRDNIQVFLDRRYNSDGNGGLFPLKRPKKDQRRVEIWYQMSDYVLENYPI